jgi:hypothetical protein
MADALIAWQRRMRRQNERRLTVWDMLFGTPPWRYFFYRVRFLPYVTLMRAFVHAIEFLLLWHMLPAGLHQAMIWRLVAIALEASWWGATDTMRHRLRDIAHIGSPGAMRAEIEGWLSLSLLAALAIMAASSIAASLATPALGLWLAAMGVQSTMRIISRTFYSAAYALKRVFMPMEWLLVLEILIYAAGAASYGWLGVFTLPLCMLLAAFVSAWIGWHYCREITQALGVTPSRIFSARELIKLLERMPARMFFLPAAAMVMIRLQETALILWLQKTAPHTLLYAVYLCAPFMRMALYWSQRLYFDFARYHLDGFSGFRRALDRQGVLFSLATGVAAAVLAGLAIMLLMPQAGGWLMPISVALCTASLIGFMQMNLFSRRDYAACVVIGAISYLLLWQFGISAALAGVALLLAMRLFAGRWRAEAPSLWPYPLWAHAARSGADALLKLRFIHGTSLRDMRIIAQSIRDALPYAKLAFDADGLLLALPAQEKPVELWRYAHGKLAMVEAFQLPVKTDFPPVAALEMEFHKCFPQGISHMPMQAPVGIARELRGDLLHDAMLAIDTGHPQRKKRMLARGWHATALCLQGEVVRCFYIQKDSASQQQLAQWHEKIDAINRAA